MGWLLITSYLEKFLPTGLSLCNMYVDTDWELGGGGYLDPIVQFDFVYQNVVDSNKNEG